LAVSISLILNSVALSAERSVIVGFHKKPGRSEMALIGGARGVIKRTFRHIPAMSVRLSDEAIFEMKKNINVAYVEEDGIFMAVEPLPGQEYKNSWGAQHIGAEVAHTSGNKGTGIKIAVLDTGIDYSHEDLDDNYIGGYDVVFDDDDPFDDNTYSHGTHIAGIIAAEQNGIGVAGVAPEAELYAVKVLDGGGFGLLRWIIEGIEWAVDNKMDIVNLSLEGMDFQSLQQACDSAYDAGVILVAAGGNTYGGNVRYPAAYDSVIAVTATDASDMRAYFSPMSLDLELAAPGVWIYYPLLEVEAIIL
jgi:subtilisin